MDKTFGGTTLVVHVEGAARPGSPNLPEYVKANVYFPDHMVREEPYTSTVVSNIVQLFIRDIGIPTIKRFDRCARLLWNKPPYSGPIPPPYPIKTTSPFASPPASSVFTYYGKQIQPTVVDSVDSDSDYDDKPQSTQIGSSANARTATVPHTPERSLSSKTLSPNNFVSPRRTLERRKSGPSNSLSLCGVGSSQAQAPVTPARARAENQYTAFIDANGLTEFHPSIDLVRRMVVMFNWKDELLNLGIDEDLVAELMSAMNSYSESERTFPSPFR